MHALVRKVAERLSRNSHVWRSLPNGRKIAVSGDAQLRYLGFTFDTDLYCLSRERIGADDVVWDVGANCGTFSFSCEAASAVVAVEADPFLCGLLNLSNKRNGNPVQIIEGAVSDERGQADFSIAARGRASNHLAAVSGSTQTGGERCRVSVQTYAMDDLLQVAPEPTFVKIDVEGAELLALKGASRLLNEIRPVLYIEVSSETVDECLNILSGAKYDAEQHDTAHWIATPG